MGLTLGRKSKGFAEIGAGMYVCVCVWGEGGVDWTFVKYKYQQSTCARVTVL